MMSWKKIVAVLLLVIGIMIPIAQAGTCKSDYYSFISDVRDENTKRSYIEDIFTLSYCQVYDILELYEELDTLRDTFRSAAFDCKDTSSYKLDYHRILMEIYFIREVQKRDPGVTREEDAEKIEQTKDKMLEDLKTDMKEKFVPERVTDTTFESFFDVWSYQYYDKIGEYARCEEGGWAELTETWTSFVETIQSLEINVEPSEEISMKDKLLNPIRDVIDGWKEMRANQEEDEPEKTTFEDAKNEASSSQSSMTIESFLDALVEDEETYDLEKAKTDRINRYEVLYGQGSAQVTTTLQTIIQEMINDIDEMNSKDLPSIKEHLAKISEKQCSE